MNRPDYDDEPPVRSGARAWLLVLAVGAVLGVFLVGGVGVWFVTRLGNPGPMPKTQSRPTPPIEAEKGPPLRVVGEPGPEGPAPQGRGKPGPW